MLLKDNLSSLLRLVRDAPESKIIDWDFKPKDRINLRLLESNGFVRVLSYGTKICWTITPKGLESINVA